MPRDWAAHSGLSGPDSREAGFFGQVHSPGGVIGVRDFEPPSSLRRAIAYERSVSSIADGVTPVW